MYIECNKLKFLIKIAPNTSLVYISKFNGEFYILNVPSDFKQEQLMPYLRTHAKTLVREFLKQTKLHTIQLYNQEFICQYSPNSAFSYRKDKRIYSHRSTSATANLKKIGDEILLSDIRSLVGSWEERLNVLIDNIYLKNFKTKKFQICHKENAIFFAKNLKYNNYSYLSFVVAKAIFDYLDVEETERIYLLTSFIQDWKHHQKIFDYEAEQLNKH